MLSATLMWAYKFVLYEGHVMQNVKLFAWQKSQHFCARHFCVGFLFAVCLIELIFVIEQFWLRTSIPKQREWNQANSCCQNIFGPITNKKKAHIFHSDIIRERRFHSVKYLTMHCTFFAHVTSTTKYQKYRCVCVWMCVCAKCKAILLGFIGCRMLYSPTF